MLRMMKAPLCVGDCNEKGAVFFFSLTSKIIYSTGYAIKKQRNSGLMFFFEKGKKHLGSGIRSCIRDVPLHPTMRGQPKEIGKGNFT